MNTPVLQFFVVETVFNLEFFLGLMFVVFYELSLGTVKYSTVSHLVSNKLYSTLILSFIPQKYSGYRLK